MSVLLRIDGDRRWSRLAAAGLVLAAWTVLVSWSLSPYAEWLDHAEMEHIAAPAPVRLAVFTLGWALMIVAMMLPATLLLLDRQDEPLRLSRLAPVIVPYLALWTVFGSLCYWADGLLHEFVEHDMPAIAGLIAPGVLLLAGLYQLTPMKHACLERCRFAGPALQHMPHATLRKSWAAGLLQGAFCLGSCWALMLLMFAGGGLNLLGMLLLGLAMTAERLAHPRAYLPQLLGVLLLALWAISIV